MGYEGTPSRDHNNPPDMIETAGEVTRNISQWLADFPTCSSEEEARQLKLQIDRAKLCLKDLDDERTGRLQPLTLMVNGIRESYRRAGTPLEAVLNQMFEVMNGYLRREEERRIALAAEAERLAREAEAKAREAERLEFEKRDDALQGEVGIDVAEYSEKADSAFEEYTAAERAAILARKEAKVRVGGGFSRAIGLRKRETLDIEDPIAVIRDLGTVPENVKSALLTAARAFRSVHGRLPKGIKQTVDRTLARNSNE